MPPYKARFPERKARTNDALAEAVRAVIPPRAPLVGIVLDTHRYRSCRSIVEHPGGRRRPVRLVVPNPAADRREFQAPPRGVASIACDLGTVLDARDSILQKQCNVAYFDYCGLYSAAVTREIREYFQTHARPRAPGVFAITCCTRGARQTQTKLLRTLTHTVARAALEGAGLCATVRATNLYQHVSVVFELQVRS